MAFTARDSHSVELDDVESVTLRPLMRPAPPGDRSHADEREQIARDLHDWSPDGQLLASGAYGAVQLWRVGETAPLWVRYVDPGDIDDDEDPEEAGDLRAVFSSDGQTLVSITGFGNARLWRVSDGVLLRAFEPDSSVSGAAFSPDGRLLALSSRDGVIRLWRVAP